MTKILFKEKQKFTQWWLWLLLIGIGLIPLVGIYSQFILGEEFGDNPMSNQGLIIFSIFIYLIIYLFYSIKLKTVISTDEIYFKFIPFLSQKVKKDDISSLEIVNYGFVGGWGIKYGSKFGTVYNIGGNKGLAIKLKNGKKFLIGTQKNKELERIVKEFF
jgi:hypothetical protein